MYEIPPLRRSPITATGVYPWIGPNSHSMPPPPLQTLSKSRATAVRGSSPNGGVTQPHNSGGTATLMLH